MRTNTKTDRLSNGTTIIYRELTNRQRKELKAIPEDEREDAADEMMQESIVSIVTGDGERIEYDDLTVSEMVEWVEMNAPKVT